MNAIPNKEHLMTREKTIHLMSGWGMLAVNLFLLLLVAPLLFFSGVGVVEQHAVQGATLMVLGGLIFVAALISCGGHVALQPNAACLYTLFGSYVGTARDSGFWWANPFRTKHAIS